MEKNHKISARQFAVLVILFTIGTTILVIPGDLAQEVKQDAWLAAVIGTVLSLILAVLFIAVGRMFPNMTIVEINEKLLGKWLGKAVSLSFVFFSLYSTTSLFQIVGTFLTTHIMPDTPIEAIHILFACILFMGIRLGLETLARAAEILFPFFIFLFIILAASVSPQIDFQNMQPVLETGIKPMIRAVFLFLSIFSLPLVVILMIFPVSVNRPKEAEKTLLSGILIGGLCLIIIILLAILVLGPENSARHMYSSYVLAKKINIGNFLQRIEAILAIMWMITIYFKITIYFYASVVGLAKTLNMKDYRPLTLPFGMIAVSLSLIVHPDVIHRATFDKEIWPLYASTYGLVLPILLLVINAVRTKILRKKGT